MTDVLDPVEAEVHEETLRPQRLTDFAGQPQVTDVLAMAIEASRGRGEALTHQLFYGPPGLGKTTLANIVANEMEADIKITSGPAIERPGDLAAILTSMNDGDVLFIDEIHRLPSTVEEILYPAMEDFAIDIVIGKGTEARAIHLPIAHITIIGATTRLGSLNEPLRDRFGIIHRLDYYDFGTLADIVERSAKVLKTVITPHAAQEIARRCRRTPRIANRLLMRCRDYAQVKKLNGIVEDMVKETMTMLGVDEFGLDALDRQLMSLMKRDYKGGPIGLKTMAALIGEPVNTVEDAMEPYLMRMGLLARTPRGRTLTEAGMKYGDIIRER